MRLAGGRQVRGVLKGWDPLLNLVLDEAVEQLRGRLGQDSRSFAYISRGVCAYFDIHR